MVTFPTDHRAIIQVGPFEMHENDSIQAYSHQKQPKKPVKMPAVGVPSPGKRDEFIMDTNSSSIVSKRSVEKLYYPGQPEYFRYFVRKFQRRSPLINRGYWLRMKAIDKTVATFLQQSSEKTKVVVNLGCGYDPLPFQYLGLRPEKCHDCVFVDVDYPQLMQKKLEVIRSNQPLLDLLPDMTFGTAPDALLGSSEEYKALGCDLKDVANLDQALRQLFDFENCSVAFLFVAEVSVAYMEMHTANAVLAWASKLPSSQFCLLEQHLPDGPDHPFAETMLKHFVKLRTPLHAIGTLSQMRQRFEAAGWPTNGIDLKTLWQVWSDHTFLSPEERRHLDTVEPFDEWEEFALFGAHYFLLRATNRPDTAAVANPKERVMVSQVAETEQHPLTSETITGSANSRRFAAAAPLYHLASHDERATEKCVAHWGGLGTRERLKTADIYHDESSSTGDNAPPSTSDLPASLMCHTITSFADKQLLLVGGRTSPDKATDLCWLFDNEKWAPTHCIPQARFRHCAVPIIVPGPSDGRSSVLVHGGKTSSGRVLNDWLVFDPEQGWQKLECTGTVPEHRFGASMSVDTSGSSGIVVGGMRDDGTIVSDGWSWRLRCGRTGLTVHCEIISGKETPGTSHISRFGAHIFKLDGEDYILGGVSPGHMLDRTNELVRLRDRMPTAVTWHQRPLLVGCSILITGEGLLLLGGGATCFSFGTFWNTSQSLSPSTNHHVKWIGHEHSKAQSARSEPVPVAQDSVSQSIKSKTSIQIPHRRLADAEDFQRILLKSQPVIFEQLDLGSCRSTWTASYLKDKIGHDRSVVVHDCPTPTMNFQTKNFAYKTMLFNEFLDKAEAGHHVYLRALSAEQPTNSPTDLATDFPGLAEDFQLPASLDYVRENAHSSPLRISGRVNMWLHYDVMANVLCQIKGSKRLLLFPPSDAVRLRVPPGMSSSSIDPFDPLSSSSSRDQPSLASATPYEAILRQGDVLFIPPMWLHAAMPLANLSVAVNVFFRDQRLDAAYAAGKDVYGNRDLAAYERGRRDLQRIGKQFDGLPQQVREFYLRRLADELGAMV